jgi:lipid-binding SYLF domain-containing protein
MAVYPPTPGHREFHIISSGTYPELKDTMKIAFLLFALTLLLNPPAFSQEKENDRIKNAGTVMSEILNVPDDIPQELLDKAKCVIVLPSVLRFAIGFGGTYGRGVMTCGSRILTDRGRSNDDGS